tara:strand:+ start:6515 stop:7969 length:1455 start_codon:yes stop_codon:yes gene_type:complete
MRYSSLKRRKRHFLDTKIKLAEVRKDLYQSNFKGQKIESLDLDDSNLQRSDFRGAVLNRVSFKDSDLEGSKFVDAVLKDVDFTSANLNDVDFSGATFSGSTHFKDAKVERAVFSEKSLPRIISTGAIGRYYVGLDSSGSISTIGDYVNTSFRTMVKIFKLAEKIKKHAGHMLTQIEADLERVEREYELDRESRDLEAKDWGFELDYSSKKRELSKLMRAKDKLKTKEIAHENEGGVYGEKIINLHKALNRVELKYMKTQSEKDLKLILKLKDELGKARRMRKVWESESRLKSRELVEERRLLEEDIANAEKELGQTPNKKTDTPTNNKGKIIFKSKTDTPTNNKRKLFKSNRSVWRRLQIRIAYLERNDKEELGKLIEFYTKNRKKYPRHFNVEKRVREIDLMISDVPEIPPGRDFIKHRKAIKGITSSLKLIVKCWTQISENDPSPRKVDRWYEDNKKILLEFIQGLKSKAKGLTPSFLKKKL